jgi:acyl-CoA synthetase (AMP-forming)/AMP-acid ligase II
LGSLRRVISAGAPVAADLHRRMARMLPPGAEVHTPYGATECLPVATVSSAQILGGAAALTADGAGVCVGRPVAPNAVHIIPIDDAPISQWADVHVLPAGEVGEIVVRGPTTTQGYFNRPESTALAKIAATDGGDHHHRMGDVGYFDAAGRLWFCGRKSQRVRTAEGPRFTTQCEMVFNAHPQVFRTALVGVGAPGGQRPVLCVELEATAHEADRATLRGALAAIAEGCAVTRGIDTFLFHPGFPVDVRHNAKIGREVLGRWAAKQLR